MSAGLFIELHTYTLLEKLYIPTTHSGKEHHSERREMEHSPGLKGILVLVGGSSTHTVGSELFGNQEQLTMSAPIPSDVNCIESRYTPHGLSAASIYTGLRIKTKFHNQLFCLRL